MGFPLRWKFKKTESKRLLTIRVEVTNKWAVVETATYLRNEKGANTLGTESKEFSSIFLLRNN